MTTVAIDFGTSNTVICIQDPTNLTPRILQFPLLSRIFGTGSGTVDAVPSLVFVQSQENLVFGEIARSQFLGTNQPERLFQGFKKDLAAQYRPPARQIDQQIYTPEALCQVFLQHLWQQLLAQDIQPTQVIFTAPVGKFEPYLNWLQSFAETLNIPKVQFLDESTAAALGYQITNPGAVILAIDFGGGTLDLSLVTTEAPSNQTNTLQAKVIATSEAYLGGLDIDTWIAQHHLQKISSSRSQIKPTGWQHLLAAAERLKIKLSTATEARETWIEAENAFDQELHLTRQELQQILQKEQFFLQVQRAVEEVLESGLRKGFSKEKIDQVLLVGGSCQIPAVQELIHSFFPADKIKLHKPLEAVATGALILSEQLNAAVNTLRYGYAIRLWQPDSQNYSYYTLFKRGTQYPCRLQRPINLQAAIEEQQEMLLDIGELREVEQGEVTYDPHNQMMQSQVNKQTEFTSLVSPQQQPYIIALQPPGKLAENRLQVMFEVNEDHDLVMTLTDLSIRRVLVYKEVSQQPSSPFSSFSSGQEGLPTDAAVLGTFQVVEKNIPVVEPESETEPVVQQTVSPSKDYFNFAILSTLTGHSASVTSIAIAPDGKTLVSGSQDKTLGFWQLPSGRQLRSIDFHKDAITCLDISTDGKMVVSASKDKTVRLWHLGTGQWLKTFPTNDNAVFSIAFSPDGQAIAWGGWDYYITLEELFSQSFPRKFPSHQGGVSALGFSLDGQNLFSCGDKAIHAWNIKPSNLIYDVTAHLDMVLTLALSPDGQTLATSGGIQDKTIKLWHLATGELIRTFSGNLDGAMSLVFSPDGQVLASTSGSAINLWHIGTGELRHSLSGHTDEVLSLAFTPDGKKLVSGSADGTIKLWGKG